MTITDTDRKIAAELGLYLVQLPETREDRKIAADPGSVRVPQNWAVKSTIDDVLVGLLNFTSVDSLYATRYSTGLSRIEETIADALRWMTRLRHVRTALTYVPESAHDRARAITVCGAMGTIADFGRQAAEDAIVGDEAHEMCVVCLAKIAPGVLKHADLRGSSTIKQREFIRSLLEEADVCGRPYLMDARAVDEMSSRMASATIDALKALKARNWQGDL